MSARFDITMAAEKQTESAERLSASSCLSEIVFGIAAVNVFRLLTGIKLRIFFAV